MENKNKDNQLKHFTAIIMLVAVFGSASIGAL